MTEQDVAALTYEQAVAELERAVAQLGREHVDLEEAVRTYERGLALARRCDALLVDAQTRLERITQTGPAR